MTKRLPEVLEKSYTKPRRLKELSKQKNERLEER